MAKLEAEQKKSLLAEIEQDRTAWMLFGIDAGVSSPAESLEGVPGLLDWMVHGQVSRLVAQGRLNAGEFCLIAGDPARGRPNLLAYRYHSTAELKPLVDRLRKLQVKEISLADATFPEDFSHKLKQTLKKEGIGCSTWSGTK